MVNIEAVADDALENVILRPRGSNTIRDLVAHIRSVAPHIRIKRSAHGVLISAFDASQIADNESLSICWTADARILERNRRYVMERANEVTTEVKMLGTRGVDKARELVSDYELQEILDDHQMVNVAAMTLPGSFGLCLFDEQGAGKTVTTIYAYDRLVAQDRADFLLIIAPKNMLSEWPKDFERFTGDLYRVSIVSGERREKRAALSRRADVVVTNFETAISMEAELKAILRQNRQRSVLVIDESFYVKNRNAKRTRALRRLREYAGFAYVLCGTPAPNRASDVVEQCNLVDFGMTFRTLYDHPGADPGNEEIRDRLAESGMFLRHLKSEVLPDLPEKSFHRVYVPMGTRQRDLYEQWLHGLMDGLRESTEEEFQQKRAHFLARRSALLQICSNPAALDPGHRELPAKWEALDGLLEELIKERGEKVVLWSFYTKTIDGLVDRYARYLPARLDGTITGLDERRSAIDRFQNDDETMLFVANPAAAGAGLTLHRARFSIYESMSNQAAHYLQSLDRTHRRGQEREVEYIILLCEDSLETLEFDRLTSKERAAADLLGDRAALHVTRESLFREISQACEILRRAE